jgi:hypothetical protein
MIQIILALLLFQILFSLYAKNSGLYSTLNPDFRFFTTTEWTTIKTSTTNLKAYSAWHANNNNLSGHQRRHFKFLLY